MKYCMEQLAVPWGVARWSGKVFLETMIFEQDLEIERSLC